MAFELFFGRRVSSAARIWEPLSGELRDLLGIRPRSCCGLPGLPRQIGAAVRDAAKKK